MIIKSKKIFQYLAALMVCTSISAADQAKIAVMQSTDGRTNIEFDYAFNELGWKADYYSYSEESFNELSENLDKYDFVITVPLFNYRREDNPDADILPPDALKDKFKKYLNDGGILVVTDGSYTGLRRWMTALLGLDFDKLETGSCNSSQWTVKGITYDAETPHPIRYFPNKIYEPNSWPHFLEPEPGSKWTTAAYCSEGFPVTFVQDVGNGLAVITTLRQPTAPQMENYYANAILRRNGIKVKNMDFSPLHLGKGTLNMELESPLKQKASLIYEITDEKNSVERFKADINGTSCKMEFKIAKRGAVKASLILDMGKDKVTLFSRSRTLPELITLKPNSYRGILSTKRRTPNVNFYVELAPVDEDLRNSKLAVSVFDDTNNRVSFIEKNLSANEIANEITAPVPMSSSLPAGEYTVRAELLKAAARFDKAKSEVKIKIMDPVPGQVIIDEDNTFLVEGSPFFPLGVYHVNPDFYPRIKEIGLNSAHLWQWDIAGAEQTDRTLKRAIENDIRVLVAMNHVGRETAIHNSTTVATNYPIILMWYVDDEPAAGNYARPTIVNDTYHEFDEQHPTFLLSCRSDIFAEQSQFGDVFAHDPYGTPSLVAEFTEKGVEAVENRKPTITVLGSFDESVSIYVPPVPFRANAYAAIVHDARGLFWYPWSQIGDPPEAGLNKSEQLQKTLTQVCSEIKTITPGLISLVRRPFKANDSVHAMVCGNEVDKRYLIMVNISEELVEVTYTVDELAKAGNVRNPFIEDKTKNIEIKDGVISRKFEPYEVLVYNW